MADEDVEALSQIAPMGELTAAQLIDLKLAGLCGWRGETLGKIRQLIRDADSDVVEEIKWRKPSNPDGVPVWSHAGMICTGEIYKEKVKLTFAKGALISDPSGLFNSSLEGSMRRAIDIFDDAPIDAAAFKRLICAAVIFNTRGRLVGVAKSRGDLKEAP